MVESPVLLDVRRGGVVESRHRGRIVLLNPSGAVEVSAGPVDAPMLPRSSLKPFQATAMLAHGFAGDEASLALAAASHDGEPMHLEGVRRTLAGAGLAEDRLQCPADLPAGRAAMLAWVAAGQGPARVCHNCSGKHAAMLATCVANDWDAATYRDPRHPLQESVRSTIERLCADEVSSVTVDGCGAPAFAISLVGLARGFAALARAAAPSAEAQVRDAMTSHPQLVGGTGRAVTDLMAGVPGLLCKDGAEGVWGAALPDGRAAAVKADDGGARTLGPLLAAVLRHWGVAGPAVEHWSTVALLGGGAEVGAVEWSPDLRALLGL